MLVAISALENNIVNSNFKIRCKESTEYFGQKYHCWKEKGHGVVDMKKAIKESCDIYFYEVARLLGVDRLYETAIKVWFGPICIRKFFRRKKRCFSKYKMEEKIYWSTLVSWERQ